MDRLDMIEKLGELFKTTPTNCELLDENTLIVHFENISVKANIKEKGCCLGQYYKWSLDTLVSHNSGKDYTPYRSYILIESLKNNKQIPLKDLMKKYNQCNIE